MDTDGSVSKNGTYTSFTSTSKRLTDDVKERMQIYFKGIITRKKLGFVKLT